jgi:hypothetical protein
MPVQEYEHRFNDFFHAVKCHRGEVNRDAAFELYINGCTVEEAVEELP